MKFTKLLMITWKSELYFSMHLKQLMCLGTKTLYSNESKAIYQIRFSLTSFRKQQVVLKRQASPWASMEAGVPQGSMLEPLLFSTYINDLFDYLPTTAKLFADDTSLFSLAQIINIYASHLNINFSKISNSAFQQKMSFNPDTSK